MKKKKRAEYSRIDHKEEVKRINRLVGQMEAVGGMLKEGRKLEAVLIQCKAIHSGLRSIEQRLIKAHLEVALDDIAGSKKKSRAEKLAELEVLFKQAS